MYKLYKLITILAVILTILILPPPQPAGACVFSDGTNIPADLTTAQAGSHCLEISAGTFTIAPTGGDWLSVIMPNVEIRGAGQGKTIIQTQGITLTNNLYLIDVHAANTYVHDLTIQIGAGYRTGYEVGGILANLGALQTMIQRVEIVGGYTGNGGNGFGIGMYQPWDQNGGRQGNTVRDCYVHDSPSTGIGVASNENKLLHNHIARVGTTPLQHGFYAQGGYNLYDGNLVENASGYSFHAWKKIPNLDASGDRYVNNVSIDPGFQHMIVSGLNNTSNPAFPNGKPLTRNVTITGNLFRNTGGRFAAGVVSDVPALIDGNTFEDVLKTGAQTIGISTTASSSIVSNNRLTGSVAANGGGTIQINAPSIVTGNYIDNPGTYQPFFGDTRGSVIANNLVR